MRHTDHLTKAPGPGKAEAARLRADSAAAIAAHPVAVALLDVLETAAKVATDQAHRDQIEHAVGQLRYIVSPLHPNKFADLEASDVERVLESLRIPVAGSEVYRLVVDGLVERTFLARNRYHAMNHVRKHDGILRAEYRFVGGRHEVHGARTESPRPPMAAAVADLVTVCGHCTQEFKPCAACEQGEATVEVPHVHHECAAMRRDNARG